MAGDQKNKNDPQSSSDMGQMEDNPSQSGQKGGQAKTDMNQEDYSRSDQSDTNTTSLGDEDL